MMNDAGIKVQSAILITTLFQIAGAVGAIMLGRIFDRGHSFKVLAMAYLGAAISVFLIGESGASVALLIFTITAAGFCVVGGQTGSLPLIAAFYPTAMRSTGVGWCLGVARIGAIIGPILGGALLSMGGEPRRVFWVISVPALIAMTSAFLVAFFQSKQTAPRESFSSH